MAAGMELLRMNAGFKLVPTELIFENGSWKKRPVRFLAPPKRSLTPGDPRFAVTDDPLVWQQWVAVCSDALMGIMPGNRFVVFDDDRGTFDAKAARVAGTYADRSPRPGTHYWARLPEGRTARYAKLPDASGDIITGAHYVVSAPSAGYSAIDVDAPVLVLPDDSPMWGQLRPPGGIPIVDLPAITRQHQERGRRVINELLRAPDAIARDARGLLAGDTLRKPSRSEADYSLAILASYWTQDPAVIAVVLWQSKLARKKWHRPDYLSRVIGAALERRATLQAQALEHPCKLSDTLPATAWDLPIKDVLLLYLGHVQEEDDFVRLPVSGFARAYGCSEKTVQRAVKRAVACGEVETRVETVHRNGRPMRTRWVRLSQFEFTPLSMTNERMTDDDESRQ
jgi:hypothetical protein